MTGATSFAASAVVGGLLVVGTPALASAQLNAARVSATPVMRLSSSAAPGSLIGVVLDERGLPVPSVVVSALGAVTTVAVTDASGRFQFGTLTPGPYLIRAHLAGYVAPRAELIQVRASAGTLSTIALRREGSVPVLAAGLGTSGICTPVAPPQTPDATGTSGTSASTPDDTGDHSETAWRIRHLRRGVLKDATLPESVLADSADDNSFPREMLGQIAGTSVNFKAMLLATRPIARLFSD